MAKRRRHKTQTEQQTSWLKFAILAAIVGAGILLAVGGGSTLIAAIAPPTPTPSPTATAVPTETPTVPPPTSTVAAPRSTASNAPIYTFEVVETYPHDPAAFTQGLLYEDGILYEGTGLRGQSTIRKVDLESGDVIQSEPIPDQFFGEGITIFEDRLIQLTWQARVGFVYDKDSFELLQEFSYPTEGWGLTHDGQRLIMSDGTATLYFLDPDSLEEIGRIEVRDGTQPVSLLNELEYIEGEIYANVWKTTRIARISPETGQVLGWIELAGLLKPEDITQPVDVLNGIAYDAAQDRLFVTGKLWPKLFEIEVVAVAQ